MNPKQLQAVGWMIVALLLIPATANADEVIHFADLDSFENEFYDFEFDLNVVALSIDSITIELAHANSNQLEFTLENIGIGQPYARFSLIDGDGGSSGNTIGVDDGDWGDFNGMSELTFVASGPSTTVRNAGDEVASGQYLAEDWENHFGSGTPPYLPSRWRFRIEDTSGDDAQVGAVGFIRFEFTPVPEQPASWLLMGAASCVAMVRRRRS